MNPTKYRHRIVLQQKESHRDEDGNVVETWKDFATVWASIQPLRGRKFFEAAAIQTDHTTRFIIRYRKGIHPDLQICYSHKTYDVKAVIDPEERHKELHLICEEGNNHWLK